MAREGGARGATGLGPAGARSSGRAAAGCAAAVDARGPAVSGRVGRERSTVYFSQFPIGNLGCGPI